MDLYYEREKSKVDLSLWPNFFTNWSHMTLRQDIVLGTDYYLVGMDDWYEITAFVEAAPTIIIYGHDFNPFKLRCNIMLEDSILDPKYITCLASPNTVVLEFADDVVLPPGSV